MNIAGDLKAHGAPIFSNKGPRPNTRAPASSRSSSHDIPSANASRVNFLSSASGATFPLRAHKSQRMKSMDSTTTIRRPPGEVFDYVMNVANDRNWRTGVDETSIVSGDVIGVGAIGRTRAGGIHADWRVTAYLPGESVDWEFVNGPYKGRGGYRVRRVEGGTEFTLVASVKPAGWMHLLGPLFYWVGQRQNQADVERLRVLLEK